jgi:hypothetical protein
MHRFGERYIRRYVDAEQLGLEGGGTYGTGMKETAAAEQGSETTTTDHAHPPTNGTNYSKLIVLFLISLARHKAELHTMHVLVHDELYLLETTSTVASPKL